MSTNQLKELPAVNEIIQEIDSGIRLPHSYLLKLAQGQLDYYRQKALINELEMKRAEIKERIVAYIKTFHQPSLKNVINGTGVTLHTGLGRAPFSRQLLESVFDRLEGYVNLEFDLESGERGERLDHIRQLLSALTGADDCLAVNNNAAAVLLSLNTLAENREVIISRGQLVEIGGSFRIPEIIGKSNCIMREVGTTNRTHRRDYEEAITGDTAVLLWAHTSNYRVEGFTAEVDLPELVELGRKYDLPVIADLGSGALFDIRQFGLPEETMVADIINAGVDIVTFSGDKLLGGPQSGLIAGSDELINRIQSNPIYRAVRLDKTVLALLEETLRSYSAEPVSENNLTWAMLSAKPEDLESRAKRIIIELGQGKVESLGLAAVPSTVEAGSGSLPVSQIPSYALRFRPAGQSVNALARRLRTASDPVVGYIKDDFLYIDLRTVLTTQDDRLMKTIQNI